jgi:hypothetical protein
MTIESIAVVLGLWVLVGPAIIVGLLDRATRHSPRPLDLELAAIFGRPPCERRSRVGGLRIRRRQQQGRFTA